MLSTCMGCLGYSGLSRAEQETPVREEEIRLGRNTGESGIPAMTPRQPQSRPWRPDNWLLVRLKLQVDYIDAVWGMDWKTRS